MPLARIRAVLLAGAVAALAVPAPAQATGSCGGGPDLATPRTGTTSAADPTDWYTATVGDVAVVSVTTAALAPSVDLVVRSADCTEVLCYGTSDGGSVESCVLTGHAGPVAVQVTYFGPCCAENTYVVSSTPRAAVAVGDEVERVTVRSVEPGTAGSHDVVGRVDQYRFPLPGGASVVLPCVILTVDGAGAGGCAAAGGTYAGTAAVLVDESVAQPSVGAGEPVVTVGVCTAVYTVTVASFGVEDFAAYSLC